MNKSKIIILLILIVLVSGCSESLKVPTHYLVEEEWDWVWSGGSETGNLNVEMENETIIRGNFITGRSGFGGGSKSVAEYSKEGNTCWEGYREISGVDFDTKEKHYSKEEGLEWNCSGSGVKFTYLYQDILDEVKETISLVKQGKDRYGTSGKDQLPQIYAKREGCNDVICFENGYLMYFSGRPSSGAGHHNWNITVIE